MSSESRFIAVSRRHFVKGSIGAGLLLAFPLAACGNDDASTFTQPPQTTDTTATSVTTAAAGTSGAGAGATPTGTGTAASTGSVRPVATPSPVATTGTAAGGRQLKIDFTFAATGGGGRVNNPFVAVWIEDANGTLVRTVSVWYSQRESKYLQELVRWYAVDDAGQTDDAISTVSSGSRAPGSYSVTWDGTDAKGAAAPAADYFVCIEAAREHGPYELVRESVALGTTALTKQLTPSGELTAASVQLVV